MDLFLNGLKEALIAAAKEGKDNSSNGISVTIPRIEPFSGLPEENFGRWAFQITDAFEARNVHYLTCLKLVPAYLAGAALQWYMSIRRIGEDPYFDSWEELLLALKRNFGRPDETLDLSRQLKRLRQTSSLQAYIGKFRDFSGQLDDASEMGSLSYFSEGLKEATKAEVLGKQPSNVEEAIGIAVGFDSARFEVGGRTHFERHSRENWLSKKHFDDKRGGHLGPQFRRESMVKSSQFGSQTAPMEVGATIGRQGNNIGSDSRMKSITCIKCGKSGHFGSQCRNRQVNVVEEEWKGYEEEEKIVEETSLLVFNAFLGKEKVSMLVDNGASYNFVNVSLVERNEDLKKRMIGADSKVFAVDGEEVGLKRKVERELILGKEVEKIKAHVIKIAMYDIILGNHGYLTII